MKCGINTRYTVNGYPSKKKRQIKKYNLIKGREKLVRHIIFVMFKYNNETNHSDYICTRGTYIPCRQTNSTSCKHVRFVAIQLNNIAYNSKALKKNL